MELHELAEKVILYRARHNLTQREFGELVGVKGQTISFLENGKHIGKMTRLKIELILEKE